MKNIIVLSLPRSGSSLLSNLLVSSGYSNYITHNSNLLNSSEFNVNGYFEDIGITLLNDQLIRLVYGSDYSFLYTPSLAKFKEISMNNGLDYSYDNDNVFFPKDYSNNIKQYCGVDWDSWGITRMKNGEKWYRCYHSYKVKNYKQILDKLISVKNDMNSKSNLIIKDPRMALIVSLYGFENCKYVYIRREKNEILNSMRNHYGVNLFSDHYIDDTRYCSNFFDYKIKYQSFDYYYNEYTSIINYFLTDKEHLTTDYNKLLDKSSILDLNKFIGNPVNDNLIKI